MPRFQVAVLAAGLLLVAASCSQAPTTKPESFKVGDVGPGGGSIFYVSPSPFPCGPALKDFCTYLEAAPPSSDVRLAWASGSLDTYPNNNWNYLVDGAGLADIGTGYKNTVDAVSHGGNLPETSALAYAYAYSNNGIDDWYLPSVSELNELCKYARHAPTGDTTILCSKSGPLRLGFAAAPYWTSTQESQSAARQQYFWHLTSTVDGPFAQAGNFKNKTLRVRPIRGGK